MKGFLSGRVTPEWEDSYLEPPCESRYVICANCGEWVDRDDAYWDKYDTPYCDEFCFDEAQEV